MYVQAVRHDIANNITRLRACGGVDRGSRCPSCSSFPKPDLAQTASAQQELPNNCQVRQLQCCPNDPADQMRQCDLQLTLHLTSQIINHVAGAFNAVVATGGEAALGPAARHSKPARQVNLVQLGAATHPSRGFRSTEKPLKPTLMPLVGKGAQQLPQHPKPVAVTEKLGIRLQMLGRLLTVLLNTARICKAGATQVAVVAMQRL